MSLDMLQTYTVVIGIGILLLFVIWSWPKLGLTMKQQEAISELLKIGMAIEYKGYHIYKSKNTLLYTILNFNGKHVILEKDDEETFDSEEKSIDRFIKLTSVF